MQSTQLQLTNVKKGPGRPKGSFGSYKYDYDSYIGKKFFKWTIISYNRRENNPRIHFNCICDCGHTSNIQARALIDGSSRSCKYCATSKHNNQRKGITNCNPFVELIPKGN